MTGKGFSTRQVHEKGAGAAAAPRVTPIYMTAGFSFDDYDAAHAHFGRGEGYAYTRNGNPTLDAAEAAVASLEGGSQAVLVSTGQAATTVALLSLASSGHHIVASNHIYEGSRGLLLDVFSRFGVTVDFVDDIGDPEAWAAAIRPETRALFAETVSNATGRILDIARIAEVAHERGLPLVVDNTFATPYLVRPIEHGADVVVHSASKFLAGQGAALGGFIIDSGTFDAAASGHLFPQFVTPDRGADRSLAERFGGDARIAYARGTLAPRFGVTASPMNGFLIAQGIETLSLRVERQTAGALAVARHLDAHPAVASVDHPGLPHHPDHDLARHYLPRGTGAVFTFTVRGGAEAARTVVEALDVFTHMTHLGDVRSLVIHPASTSHVQLGEAEQRAVGVYPGTLRLSIGIEDIDDLIAALDVALERAAEVAADSAAPEATRPTNVDFTERQKASVSA